MNKIIFLVVVLCLGGLSYSVQADSYTLTDGNVLTGDMIKFDDNGIMVRQPGEVYTNVSWTMLSQDTLKQLAQNPKISPVIQPLLEPAATARPPKPVIDLHEVNRLKTPASTSVIGGLFSSSVGLFMGLLIYAANLFAGFEVAICRNRPPVMVVLFSGILPIIAPIIFFLMPAYYQSAEEELPVENDLPPPTVPSAAASSADGATQQQRQDTQPNKSETQQARPTWTTDQPKKQQTQVFQRGKFMFNKRFIETKFGLFLKGPSKDVVLVLITPKGQFVANRIGEVTPTEMQIFCDDGEALVAYTDIQEAHIKPRP